MVILSYLLNILIILILYTIGKFVWKIERKKRRLTKYVKHLPTPKEYPLFGSALRFFGKNTEGVERRKM